MNIKNIRRWAAALAVAVTLLHGSTARAASDDLGEINDLDDIELKALSNYSDPGSVAAASAVAVKKWTKFEKATATPLVVKRGETLKLNAKLYYLDKQSRWQELANKRVEWYVSGVPLEWVTTDDHGRAPYSFAISTKARPGLYYARVYFRGDLKYKNSYSRRVSFRVVP